MRPRPLRGRLFSDQAQHCLRLGCGRKFSFLVDIIGSAETVEIHRIGAVGLSMSRIGNDDAPCAAEHRVGLNRRISAVTHAQCDMFLLTISARNGLVIVGLPRIARVLATGRIAALAALHRRIDIGLRRRPKRTIGQADAAACEQGG